MTAANIRIFQNHHASPMMRHREAYDLTMRDTTIRQDINERVGLRRLRVASVVYFNSKPLIAGLDRDPSIDLSPGARAHRWIA